MWLDGEQRNNYLLAVLRPLLKAWDEGRGRGGWKSRELKGEDSWVLDNGRCRLQSGGPEGDRSQRKKGCTVLTKMTGIQALARLGGFSEEGGGGCLILGRPGPVPGIPMGHFSS